jgi:hypothetical protein
MSTKKVTIGMFQTLTTWVWREGIEFDIPEDMTPQEFLDNMADEDPDRYEELMEQMYDADPVKEKPATDENEFWAEDENGNRLM